MFLGPHNSCNCWWVRGFGEVGGWCYEMEGYGPTVPRLVAILGGKRGKLTVDGRMSERKRREVERGGGQLW